MIVTRIRLDREIAASYRLIVEVYDENSSTMATVDVFILDSNDQTPFLYDVTDLTVSSQLPIGSIVKCFSPSDTDAVAQLEFTLTKGNEWLSIDRFNGCLFLINTMSTDKQAELTVTDGINVASKSFLIKVNSSRMFSIPSMRVITVDNDLGYVDLPNVSDYDIISTDEKPFYGFNMHWKSDIMT